MTIRTLGFSAAILLLASPAFAQSPDFGDDASQWASDGECDDPRFEGAGMTQTPLLDADALHDATDCRAAFQAGSITLADVVASTPPVKGGQAPVVSEAPESPDSMQVINFGDDSSQWANDGECDDRRFAGQGMATSLSWSNVGRDRTDCVALFDAYSIFPWQLRYAALATQCETIDFGDDTGQFAGDNECDDIRFEGLGMAASVGSDLIGRDAADCSRLCTYGLIGVRDY